MTWQWQHPGYDIVIFLSENVAPLEELYKAYTGSLYIIPYNFMEIYNYLNQISIFKKTQRTYFISFTGIKINQEVILLMDAPKNQPCSPVVEASAVCVFNKCVHHPPVCWLLYQAWWGLSQLMFSESKQWQEKSHWGDPCVMDSFISFNRGENT